MSWFNYGTNSIYDALVEGRDVSAVAASLAERTNTPAGMQAYTGALTAACSMISDLATKKTVDFRNDDEHPVAKAIYAHLVERRDPAAAILEWESRRVSNDSQALTDWNTVLFATLERARRAKGVKFSRPEAVKAEPEKEAPPMKVEIIGMPDRQIMTTVARDGDGQIVASTQVESDRV